MESRSRIGQEPQQSTGLIMRLGQAVEPASGVLEKTHRRHCEARGKRGKKGRELRVKLKSQLYDLVAGVGDKQGRHLVASCPLERCPNMTDRFPDADAVRQIRPPSFLAISIIGPTPPVERRAANHFVAASINALCQVELTSQVEQ